MRSKSSEYDMISWYLCTFDPWAKNTLISDPPSSEYQWSSFASGTEATLGGTKDDVFVGKGKEDRVTWFVPTVPIFWATSHQHENIKTLTRLSCSEALTPKLPGLCHGDCSALQSWCFGGISLSLGTCKKFALRFKMSVSLTRIGLR